MIGDDGGTLRHHQRQVRVQDCLAIQRAIWPEGPLPCAEAIFTADKEWKVLLELALVRGKKSRGQFVPSRRRRATPTSVQNVC